MKMRLQNSPEKEEPPSERNGVNKSGLGATIGVGTVCDDGLGFPSSRFEINVSRLGFKADAPKRRGVPSEPKNVDAAQAATVEPEAAKVRRKKKGKRQETEVQENLGEENAVEAPVGESSGRKKEKRKLRKKNFIEHMPSSIGSRELRDLAPNGGSQGRAVSDPVSGYRRNEYETATSSVGRKKKMGADGEDLHVASEGREDSSGGRREDLEGSINAPLPEHRDEGADVVQLENSLERSQSRVLEGSEARVSGSPKATLPDKIKGGPDELPEVKDLVFNDDYEVAARSSVRSQGDWSSLDEKYDTTLKQALTRVREGEEKIRVARLDYQVSLQTAVREKEEMLAREKTLRKELDERSASAEVELRMSRESIERLEQVVDKLEREKDEGLSAGSMAVSTCQTVLPANPLSDASAKVFEVTDTSSPNLTGFRTNKDRSGTHHEEKGPASSGGQAPATNEDPPALTFGRVSGPEETVPIDRDECSCSACEKGCWHHLFGKRDRRLFAR
ncbi:hypothetical protein Bca52824_001249 [Brassica carinata]|uniref:Uncharacterized protein n=1 Tax=Brassica carinata TaxID=52824 RepID=A0A8X8B9L6_BRACI|nr:hypothetical protein Bca52824_001249 [Brassica carinata]